MQTAVTPEMYLATEEIGTHGPSRNMVHSRPDIYPDLQPRPYLSVTPCLEILFEMS